MRNTTAGLAAIALALVATTATAQPGHDMAPMHMRMQGAPMEHRAMMNGAEFFLGHTGDLKLTDAQVTRLAAIARRTEERRKALHASMDSAGPMRMGGRPDSATRAGMAERMRTAMQREHEQSRVDLRDALVVLNPDQLVTAWELRAGPPPDHMRMKMRMRVPGPGSEGRSRQGPPPGRRP